MRVWDVDPAILCRQHLLGEHRELHGLWNILVLGKDGYSKHPETLRWIGRQKALFLRHEALVVEMKRRGYNHNTPLDANHATGKAVQDRFVDPPARQHEILWRKRCECKTTPPGNAALV